MSEHMVVTVCTRERPKMLMACLRSVLPQLEAAKVQTSLVVVENDIEPKNEEAVLGLGEQFPAVRIEYRLEPELGIPFARNTAVETALGLGADWIFFIDDDEEACEGWFDAYLAAMREWDADIFRGPVHFIYPPGHPQWLRRTPFDGGKNGSQLFKGGTENIACRSYLFASDGYGLAFDTRFRFTGGEDVDLFRRAVKCRAKIRWIKEGKVVEKQTGQRLTSRWMLFRQRSGAAFYAKNLMGTNEALPLLRFFIVRTVRNLLQMTLRLFPIVCLSLWKAKRQEHLFYLRKKLAVLAGYYDALRGRLPDPYM